MSYPKVIDASFIKEFTSNFPKHAKPFTNEQLINIWTQKNSKELLNEYSGVVTIARTHRSIVSTICLYFLSSLFDVMLFC
jgi:ribosomal protein S17E